ILPSMSKKATLRVSRKLNDLGVDIEIDSEVLYETTRTLRVDQQSIPTKSVIWTAGTVNNPFYEMNSSEFDINSRHKIVVDDRLQVDKHTYVIGDNAATTYSGLAQTAIHQANYVSRNIVREISGKEHKSYKSSRPTSVIPVGRDWAVLQYGSLVITGRIASLVRYLADLIGYADVMGWRESIKIWRSETKSIECKFCQDSEQ
ncbi:FAD-dependent oxidoreductase, partial [Candidatus Saccharibacteria bacterium]|nr:FAD-dependent oxidoreductase [Candidatus Saccharibacteria bacterium]